MIADKGYDAQELRRYICSGWHRLTNHNGSARFGLPALVLHGQWDETAPLAEAVGMFHGLRSERKHLEIIPGAGHNDLMYVGYRQYFGAIGRFVGQYGRSSPARATAF